MEKPRIDNIVVEGSKDIDQEDVLAAMGTKSGSVLNEQMLSDDLQKITELYRKEGYYLAKANYRLEDRQGGRGAVLIISVDEGNKLYIKEVKIEGLKELSQGDMDKYLALKPRNIFSPLRPITYPPNPISNKSQNREESAKIGKLVKVPTRMITANVSITNGLHDLCNQFPVASA